MAAISRTARRSRAWARIFNFVRYKTVPPRGHIDYDAVRAIALKETAEDAAVRTLLLSARARLRALSRDRR